MSTLLCNTIVSPILSFLSLSLNLFTMCLIILKFSIIAKRKNKITKLKKNHFLSLIFWTLALILSFWGIRKFKIQDTVRGDCISKLIKKSS